jgi:hypothetical protein
MKPAPTGPEQGKKMKSFVQALALGAVLLLSSQAHAQTAAPSATKGVMVANPMAAAAPGAQAEPAARPAARTEARPTAPTAASAAPGGDKVWVNTASKVYHCAGTRYYGKTKAGQYMTQAEAKAGGHRANKTCP